MALWLSQAVRWASTKKEFGDDDDNAHYDKQGPLPIIASPVDPDALKWLRRKRRGDSKSEPIPGQVRRSMTVAQFEAEHSASESTLAGRIFRKQHAASSLELFFDLFFVANLAVFTTNHEHVSLLSKYGGRQLELCC